MSKQGFSIFSIHEMLASPSLRPVIERLHPAAVLMTVKGVYDDVTREMFSAVGERRVPEIAELTDKILARLLDVEKKGNRLLIDARGVLFPKGPAEPPLGRSVLDEMIWRIDVPPSNDPAIFSPPTEKTGDNDWLEKVFPSPERVARLLSTLTGAEDALFFGSPEQAELALLSAYGRWGTILLARRDLCEESDGRRFENRLNSCVREFRAVGASNVAHPSDFAENFDDSISLIRLCAQVHSDLTPTLSDAEVRSLRETMHGGTAPIVCRLDFAPLIDLSPHMSRPIPTLGDRVAGGCDLWIVGTGQLIGGPNCGALIGSKRFLEPLRVLRLPELFSAHRVDLAGLAKTLELYRNRLALDRSIPILSTVMTSRANLLNRAERLLPQLSAVSCVAKAEQRLSEARLYPGGSLGLMPSVEIVVTPKNRSADDCSDALRRAAPGIETVVSGSELWLDLKTVPPQYDAMIVQIFEQC